MSDPRASKELTTKDYEILWSEKGEKQRVYINSTLDDIVELAKAKALDGFNPVHVVERTVVASVTLGTNVEFKR